MISVLYVDDERALLDIGKLFLEVSGELSVQTTLSVKKAYELMKKENFDVIVSDYQMPDTDGIDFLKQIRGSGNNIPFILFTGRGREEIVIDAINNGVDFYLQKGGNPKAQFAELEHKIKIAVKLHREETGIIHVGSKNFVDAIDCFNRAVKNNPEIKNHLTLELIDLIKNGQIVEALQFCNRKLIDNPKLTEIWLIKAFLIGIGEKNYKKRSNKIFISYSVEDQKIAYQICHYLEENGTKCWIAPRDISPTRIWPGEIRNAIEDSTVVILLLSKSSNNSHNVLREIVVASKLDKKIVPVRIEKVEPSESLDYLLQIWQFIDIYERDWTEQIQNLSKRLQPV